MAGTRPEGRKKERDFSPLLPVWCLPLALAMARESELLSSYSGNLRAAILSTALTSSVVECPWALVPDVAATLGPWASIALRWWATDFLKNGRSHSVSSCSVLASKGPGYHPSSFCYSGPVGFRGFSQLLISELFTFLIYVLLFLKTLW